MVSDNGPAFSNNLTTLMAAFFGFRHVTILPYNAQANGIAEASVKRIKLLLDRHVKGYADWHKILPLAQLQLNAVTHSGTGVSPFMALFGYQPTGIEKLENPALLAPTTTGSEWLGELRSRIVRLHREIQAASDAIKAARVSEANARRRMELDSRAGAIQPSTVDRPSYVRMIRGSEEDARYVRKHGHGAAWKHRYKVLEVRPHAVRLEIPKDGSVPQVNEWQLIRRCEPAPAAEHRPLPTDPKLTELGIPLLAPPSVLTPSWDPSKVYDIDQVLDAEKVSGKYRLWIKWKGWKDDSGSDTTTEWAADITKQTSNEELLREIRDAIDRCKARQNDRSDDPVMEDDAIEEDIADENDAIDADLQLNPLDPQPGGRPVRNRRNIDRFEPTFATVSLRRFDNQLDDLGMMLSQWCGG